jgi:hypothetical protein
MRIPALDRNTILRKAGITREGAYIYFYLYRGSRIFISDKDYFDSHKRIGGLINVKE